MFSNFKINNVQMWFLFKNGVANLRNKDYKGNRQNVTFLRIKLKWRYEGIKSKVF